VANRSEYHSDPIDPFGIIVSPAESGVDPRDLPVESLHNWATGHRVVVLREFAPLEGDAFVAFAAALGEILEWEFGSVNELRVKDGVNNYLYTTHEVPFHWDGAFVGRVPRYIVFQCDAAPASGGETLFSDTTRVLADAPPEVVELWSRASITYSTDKVVHYGGSFTSSVLSRHPITGERTLRFAEPVYDLNPVRLELHGVEACERAPLLDDLAQRLREPSTCYAHVWRAGDLVVADNHVLLHGRRPFDAGEPRRIRRVNVL
jgi:alpha-ketoglutarate-dependent taurine dioxygenase